MKNYMILILLLLVVGGCSGPRLMVQMEKGVSLSEYKVFEVMPVSNETGKTFEFDVADELTQHIKAKIKDKGYVINERKEAKDSVLVIKSSLTAYEPGSARPTVRALLIDKMTGKVIGEMVAIKGIGLAALPGAYKRGLEVIAQDIANEIDKNVKGD